MARSYSDREEGTLRMRRVWLYVGAGVEPEKLLRLERSLEASGFEVAVHPSYPLASRVPRIPASEAAKWADLIIAVGGDGTLLKAYHEAGNALPFLGVNCGSIGYLMEVPLPRLEEALALILAGKYRVEERMVGLVSAEQWSSEFVNEVVVTSPHHGKLIRLSVHVDGAVLLQGRFDGLIVATPTGSTAYALSAGGPVVDANLHAFSIVPLAPFTALAKPLVVASSRRVEVAVEGACLVTVDGQSARKFKACTVSFTEAPNTLKLVKLPVGEDPWTKLVRRLTDTPLLSSSNCRVMRRPAELEPETSTSSPSTGSSQSR